IRKLHHDTLDLTPHTTSLFPTAITLPKGREFQDYRLFGLLSGVQYGVTDRLELGYKIVTPFVIGVMAEPDVFPYFLMWGVQANFKYQLVKGEFFNLAVMGAGPSPMGEVIVTLGGAKRALTMAAGAMHFLDSEVSLQWYRISGKLRLSSKAQLFGEYMDISTVGNPDDGMVLSSVALRRFWGRFNVDFGLGYMREKNDTDGLPLLYLNFGYSE
ncbi:hypothetical protein KJ865_12695, partial [Myxococcota bacterium]|nr:hypothetical protein [Myxococcota bacterium]